MRKALLIALLLVVNAAAWGQGSISGNNGGISGNMGGGGSGSGCTTISGCPVGGAVSLGSNPVTGTAFAIGGGTADAVTIGSTTPAPAAVTSLASSAGITDTSTAGINTTATNGFQIGGVSGLYAGVGGLPAITAGNLTTPIDAGPLVAPVRQNTFYQNWSASVPVQEVLQNLLSTVTLSSGEFDKEITVTGSQLVVNAGVINTLGEAVEFRVDNHGTLTVGGGSYANILQEINTYAGSTAPNVEGINYNVSNQGSIQNLNLININPIVGNAPTGSYHAWNNADPTAGFVNLSHAVFGGTVPASPPTNVTLLAIGQAGTTFPFVVESSTPAFLFDIKGDASGGFMAGTLGMGSTGTAAGKIQLFNGANGGSVVLQDAAAATAGTTISFPATTSGTDTVAVLGTPQTFSAAQTFSSTITASGLGSGTAVSCLGITSGNQIIPTSCSGGSGVTSITAGGGLTGGTITTTGTIALDLTAANTWTGAPTFNTPVVIGTGTLANTSLYISDSTNLFAISVFNGATNEFYVKDSGIGFINGQLILGTAGSTLGNVTFNNLTSGSITLRPPTGALGAATLTMPAVTDTLAVLGTAQTFTAAQTFSSNVTVVGKLIFTGAAPTITSGTATLDATASNQAGTVTEGTAQTGFTLTFNTANPFSTTPHCVVSSPNGSALTSYTPSTTTLVVANLTATGSSFTYACFQ